MKKILFISIFVVIGICLMMGLLFFGPVVKVCKTANFSIENSEYIIAKSLNVERGMIILNDSIFLDPWICDMGLNEMFNVLVPGSVIFKKANSREIIIKSKRGDKIFTKLLPIWHTQDSLMKRKYEICCDARLNIIRKIGLINLKCD